MTVSRATALGFGMLLLAGCADLARMDAAQKQAQMDAFRQKCTDYGYTPGTDRFADCMMQQDNQAAYERQRKQDLDARKRALSLQRSGDTRFPVCGAASPGASLDAMGGFWYGDDCRAR